MAPWVTCFLLKHDLSLDFQNSYNQSVIVCASVTPVLGAGQEAGMEIGGGAGAGDIDWGRGRGRGWRRQGQVDLHHPLPARFRFRISGRPCLRNEGGRTGAMTEELRALAAMQPTCISFPAPTWWLTTVWD